MCRIVDILLLMLLHADTTRVAVDHFDRDLSMGSKDQLLFEMNEVNFSLSFDDDEHEDENQGDHETESEDIDDGKQVSTLSLFSPNEIFGFSD